MAITQADSICTPTLATPYPWFNSAPIPTSPQLGSAVRHDTLDVLISESSFGYATGDLSWYALLLFSLASAIMACCYIAALCIGTLVKACQFLDFDDNIRYNEDGGPKHSQSHQRFQLKAEEPRKPSSEPSAVVLSLSGLTCAACVGNVERVLADVPSVAHARVSLPLQQATAVAEQGQAVDEKELINAVKSIGYGAEIGPRSPKEIVDMLQSRQEVQDLKNSFASFGRYAALIQLIGYAASKFENMWPNSVMRALNLWLALGLVTYSQFRHVSWIHSDGWKALFRTNPNMNTLVSLSICIGLSFSLVDLVVRGRLASSYHSAIVGLTLVTMAGRCLEALSRRQSSKDLLAVYKPLVELEFTRLSSTGQVSETLLR